MNINGEIVKLSSQYVVSYLEKDLPEGYCYHNESHTISMVNAINEISQEIKLTDRERYVLLTAGWFHDLGYIWQIEEHEAVGACIAEVFLTEKQVSKTDIDEVKRCIMATKYLQKPYTILEQVIGDADMIHLGKKEFFEKTALVREEWSGTRQRKYTDEEWYQSNLDFMKEHTFHTAYCRKNYNGQKEKNIKQIEKLLKKEKQNSQLTVIEENDFPKKNKGNKEKADRGIDRKSVV